MLHRLDYLTVGSSCTDDMRAHYTEFGLTERSRGSLHSVTGGEQLRILDEDAPRVVEIGVGVDTSSDLAEIAKRAREWGAEVDDTAAEVRVVEPVTRIVFRLTVSPRLAPERATPVESADRSNLVARAEVAPLRLGHVVVGTPDVDAGASFCLEALGLRLSDYVGTGAFMRFDTDHHNVCFVKGDKPFLHHSAWKVRNIDEVGFGGSQMVKSDPGRHAWGLGRHAASANYFWYLHDPNGSYSEYYYSEFDELVDDPLFWDRDPAMGILPPAAWGPPPPPNFNRPPAAL